MKVRAADQNIAARAGAAKRASGRDLANRKSAKRQKHYGDQETKCVTLASIAKNYGACGAVPGLGGGEYSGTGAGGGSYPFGSGYPGGPAGVGAYPGGGPYPGGGG